MLWTPKNHAIGDIVIIHDGESYHLFTEAVPIGGTARERIVLHAKSSDLLHWEELPPALYCGPLGAFDGYTLYHMDVLIHEGTWHMYYTGLDRAGVGQQQKIGLATSRDGITWQKSEANPILSADLRYYEAAYPAEASYQEKDLGRLCFRDPMIIQDEKTGIFGMIVVARDIRQHLDVRACLAWATSEDLLNWEAKLPLYSPGRFHTIETPSLFRHGNRHYIIFMTHPGWGPPVIATDPYQHAGNFYAVSENGPLGPYRQPKDEVVMAAYGNRLRMGAQRLLEGPNGELFLYGWIMCLPDPDDEQVAVPWLAVPPPKRVHISDAGELEVVFNDQWIEKASEVSLQLNSLEQFQLQEAEAWKMTGAVVGKNFKESSAALFQGVEADFIFSARLRIVCGERAGLVARSTSDCSSGWKIMADRRFHRVEFSFVGESTFVDARSCHVPDEFELKIMVYGACIEIYFNNRCLIHQVRYREKGRHVGYIVDRSETVFFDPRLYILRS